MNVTGSAEVDDEAALHHVGDRPASSRSCARASNASTSTRARADWLRVGWVAGCWATLLAETLSATANTVMPRGSHGRELGRRIAASIPPERPARSKSELVFYPPCPADDGIT
jgi:hypothetical protein